MDFTATTSTTATTSARRTPAVTYATKVASGFQVSGRFFSKSVGTSTVEDGWMWERFDNYVPIIIFYEPKV